MWKPLALAACLAVAATVAAAQPAPRQLYITADSEHGWRPTPELEAQARRAAFDYLDALDQGQAAAAYDRLADQNKARVARADYLRDAAVFHMKSGPVVRHAITRTTWTKDAPNGPAPGVYAAIDISSRYVKVDRHCGTLIMYQPPAGGDFRVMREDFTWIDNASASRFTGREIETYWAQVSARCPNYAGLVR